MRRMWSELAFLPTLGYNLVRNYLQADKWPWYSRIDSVLLVGGLPFKSMISEVHSPPHLSLY